MSEPDRYVLGLDMGVASIGWALVRLDARGRPSGIMRMGAHLFEAGTDGGKAGLEGIASGRDTPLNTKRRQARLMRRQIWRRARRKRKLLRLLVEHGLLPPTLPEENDLKRPLDIDSYMKRIDGLCPVSKRTDAGLGQGPDGFAQVWSQVDPGVAPDDRARVAHENQTKWPYLLRSAAASRRVEVFDAGRALYHLAQRRGFLSNRRADAKKKDDDSGAVKQGIKDLSEMMREHAERGGVPTLGGYLASLNTDEQRLRGRWTARQMFVDEFDAIWREQAGHHAAMDDGLREEVRREIFWQRPLKDQNELVGRCSLEPDQRRAPLALRAVQRFRVLQTVNAIEVAEPNTAPRPLSDEERESLTGKLLRDGDTTFTDAKKVMGFKRNVAINFERGEAKKLIGHRTDEKLRGAIGDKLDAMDDAARDALVEDLRQLRTERALVNCAQAKWGFTKEESERLTEVGLEEDRASLSLRAIAELMPLLEQGMTYGEARRRRYPASFASTSPHEVLPPALEAMPDLRNPGVLRALTEARKLVNAVVRAHGKPEMIRVELARELKNPRAVRERISKDNRAREKLREEAKAEIVRQCGIPRPSRDDVERALLWDECGGMCPYTGKHIEFRALFGKSPQFDVEHIWPRSRCLDDSFMNKTLCDAEFNRSRKRNRLPSEALPEGDERSAVLQRVRSFKGDMWTRREKLRRFEAEAIDDGFENRHLTETRYIARAAADFFGLLYGGRNETGDDGLPGRQRVGTPSGGLTAWLRSGWGLNTILAEGAEPWEQAEKNREDHRHHAIDALVVALSDQRAVKFLAEAAKRADDMFRRRAFERVEEPWSGFRDEAVARVEAINVSHRQSRKVSGALHQESNYSRPIRSPGGIGHRIRKELHKLTPSEVTGDAIVDRRAREAVRAVLARHGKDAPTPRDIAQIFSDPANAPLVKGHDGRMVRLRKVRVEADPAVPIGTGAAAKHVMTSSNHHTVIYAAKDSKGREKWEDEPVTLLECYRRVAAREPVVRRDDQQGRKALFSLAPGEFVEMSVDKSPESRRAVFRMLSISSGDNRFQLHRDAREREVAFKDGAYVRANANKLRLLGARKVHVTYLGEIKPIGG